MAGPEHGTTHDNTPDTDQFPAQGNVRIPPQAATMPTPPRPAPEPAVHLYHKVRRTRLHGLWIAVTGAAVVLLLLLVFIVENGDSVHIAFFGAHGSLPLGVALLLAAICGVLLVAIPGYGRILQLRRALRKSANG